MSGIRYKRELNGVKKYIGVEIIPKYKKPVLTIGNGEKSNIVASFKSKWDAEQFVMFFESMFAINCKTGGES